MPKVRQTHKPREGPQIVLALILLIFVGAASLSDGRLLPDFSSPPEATRSMSGGDALITGSILVVPPQGNVCEHRLIDNETWRIRPAGFVACDEAVAWNARQRQSDASPSRLEAIRSAFNPRRQP